MNPKYPIYIISKGRYDTYFTSKALEKINVPYRIVIEPAELRQYSDIIDKNKIIILPEDYSKLGEGSIPARNWTWNHSIKEGWERHWILDDNIRGFYRLNNNLRIPISVGTIFKCAEDFTERYINIKVSGFNYCYLMPRKNKRPPYHLNTRIYSCILLANDLDIRWRGRYNEDTDLSLRILKAGYCTVLFNAFLADKATTMTMSGGNAEKIYNTGDNRRAFAESLKRQHPDIVKVIRKYGRWHHTVDYRRFRRNKLIKKEGLRVIDRINNYGMALSVKNSAGKK